MFPDSDKTTLLNHQTDDIATNFVGENYLDSDSQQQAFKDGLAKQEIVFHIKGIDITLPQQAIIVVGRVTKPPNQSQADIDLSMFELGDKSISRRHIAVQRRDSEVYVIDLYSSNGTWLNGLRLLPNTPHCLQNGAEIRLGRVIVQVKCAV